MHFIRQSQRYYLRLDSIRFSDPYCRTKSSCSLSYENVVKSLSNQKGQRHSFYKSKTAFLSVITLNDILNYHRSLTFLLQI